MQVYNDFAFGLYARLLAERGDQSLFFSPYSIAVALTMAAEGARGETGEAYAKRLAI